MSAVASIPRAKPKPPRDKPAAAEPTVSIEVVTPEQAHEYLGYNTHNRNLRGRPASAFAADMANGDFLLNGETIKFATDGTLLDGQHRLAAIVESGVAIRTIIVRGLPSATQETMDGGMKRTFPDVLKLRGEVNYITLATTIRAVAKWEAGIRGRTDGGSSGPFTNAQLFRVLDTYPWLRDGCILTAKTATSVGLPGRVGGLLWWLCMRISPEDTEAFFDRLNSDENHKSGDPIYELRKAIQNNSAGIRGERTGRYLLAISIKAWNKYRDGETVGVLKFRPGGANPERFPEPR